jgi:predicted RNA binding protein YcfA (HicA-like mRNA interferase family)
MEKHGFIAVRQRGSHIAMQRLDSEGATVTAIVPNHKQIRAGTLQSIIRQSGLSREVFEAK